MLFLHDENQNFVERQSQSLVEEQEVFQNINWKTDLPPLMSAKDKNISITFTLSIAILFVVMGGNMTRGVISRMLFLQSQNQLHVANILQEILFLAAGLLLVCMGIYCLLGVRKFVMYNPEQTREIYRKLLSSGVLLEGTLVKVRFAFENRKVAKAFTRPPNKELIYKFISPDNEAIVSSYITPKDVNLLEGGKVQVLYYDKSLDIIL